MREIFIFRHGETDWNREGRFQGQSDIPLNDLGRSQAAALIEPLGGHAIEAILSSDLGRAYETARIVANRLGVPVFVDEGLREAHLGGAQGKTKEELKDIFGRELVRRWKSVFLTDADVAYPGGETGNEVTIRVFRAIEQFLEKHPYTRFGVACHGGVIRRVMQKILAGKNAIVPIPNGVVYRLTYDVSNRLEPWKTEVPPHQETVHEEA